MLLIRVGSGLVRKFVTRRKNIPIDSRLPLGTIKYGDETIFPSSGYDPLGARRSYPVFKYKLIDVISEQKEFPWEIVEFLIEKCQVNVPVER